MNKNFLIGAVVVILVLAGGAFLVKNSKTATQNNNSAMEKQSESQTVDNESMEPSEATEKDEEKDKSEADENEGKTKEGVKSFEISSANFKFDKSELKVKQGDKVKITLENDEGMHDWVIDEFNVKTKLLKAGEKDTVEFVANKKGTFEYYCSVGQHRQNGMKGNLIVE